MNRFRLIHWAELPHEFDQLKFRRAMSAMSAGPVGSDQLSRECGLNRKELLALLRTLITVGAITVHPSKQGGRGRGGSQTSCAKAAPHTVRPMMSRLRNWLMAGGPFDQVIDRG